MGKKEQFKTEPNIPDSYIKKIVSIAKFYCSLLEILVCTNVMISTHWSSWLVRTIV